MYKSEESETLISSKVNKIVMGNRPTPAVFLKIKTTARLSLIIYVCVMEVIFLLYLPQCLRVCGCVSVSLSVSVNV